MDIASFLFGIALGIAIGSLVTWLAGRVTTARILTTTRGLASDGHPERSEGSLRS